MNKILVILALVAAVVAGWYFLSPSEESRVRETFKKMESALEKSGSESNFKAIEKARHAVALVEPGCTFELVDDGGTKKFALSTVVSDITQKVVAFRMQAGAMMVSFEDVKVTFTDKTTAETACDFFYKGDDFGFAVRDARALEATLRKDPESGRWRFARVRVLNIIEK